MLDRINREDFWYLSLVFSLIKKIIWQYPLSLLSIPFIFKDWYSISILPLLVVLDTCVYLFAARYVEYHLNRRIKNDTRDKCLSGKLTIYNSQLVERFRDMVSKMHFHSFLFLKQDVIVLLSDKIAFSATTFSSSAESTIVINEGFDENEMKDVYLLAHEFGHVYHFFKRIELTRIPVITIILQFLLIVNAFFYGSVIWCVLLLLANIAILFICSSQFELSLESEADLLALQIIEVVWGKEEMQKAAVNFIKKRIISAGFLDKNNNFLLPRNVRISMEGCIGLLARFVPFTERKVIIERSKARSSLIMKNPLLNARIKNEKLQIEKRIRDRIIASGTDSIESPHFILLKDSSIIKLLYNVCLIISIISLFQIVGDYSYNWGYSPLWIALIVSISLYIINSLISISIWKKRINFRKRIGL